jgi:peptidoglycan-associated lipoprotein
MRGQNVAAAAVLARALACGGLLMLLASCQSTSMEQRDVQEPPTSGETNDPAAGFQNMQAGSEEDFILNVGRRTFFPAGAATLDSVAKATLDSQIAWLNKYPQWLVKLQGFADDGGSESAQVTLSQKRADAVMSYLAAGGLAQTRMWAKGYGKDREVRACPDKACKVQNRRVVTNLRNERDTP